MTLVVDKHQLDTKYRLLHFERHHILSSDPDDKLVYLYKKKHERNVDKIVQTMAITEVNKNDVI